MDTLALLMAAFLAVGSYQNPNLDHQQLVSATPEARVQAFHESCQALLNLDVFKEEKNLDIDMLVGFAQNMLKQKQKEKASSKDNINDKRLRQLSKIIDPAMFIGLYQDVCKTPNADADKKYFLKAAAKIYKSIYENLPPITDIETNLPQTSYVYDRKGELLTEVYLPEHRRLWVDYGQIPDMMVKALIAIEDQRFFEHKGIDTKGLFRAFFKTMSGSVQGGSTITQQLAKNLYFREDVEMEQEQKDIRLTILRKIKEIIQTKRIEAKYSKERIFEFYANLIYLGRSSWGLRTASKSYFGRELNELSLAEMALIAALPRGPNNYEPFLFRKRAIERRNKVLDRMADTKDKNGNPFITKEEAEVAKNEKVRPIKFFIPNKIPYVRSHLAEVISTESGQDNFFLTQNKITTTINMNVQRDLRQALRKTLTKFHSQHHRRRWTEPVTNIAEYLEQKTVTGKKLPWFNVFKLRSLRYQDVDYELGLVLGRGKGNYTIGLRDGKIARLDKYSLQMVGRRLKYGDVVYMTKSKAEGFFRLIFVPKVQGAAIALDAHTGGVIGVAGGFTYGSNPFNRAIKGLSQPGSTMKPLVYLTALSQGYQPNTLIPNSPTYLPRKKGCGGWSPRNYSYGRSRAETMRVCLEQSQNLCIANMINRAREGREVFFQKFRSMLQELGLYENPAQCYPISLGAQATSVYRLARAYATIPNGGYVVEPRFWSEYENGGSFPIKANNNKKPSQIVDAVAAYQTKAIMQGVFKRGTARRKKEYAPYLAGKTGTSQNHKSSWFVAMSNDVVVVTYVAYDNNKPLAGKTGADLALPMATDIFDSVFANYSKKEPLNYNVAGAYIGRVGYKSGRPGGDMEELLRQGVDINPYKLIGGGSYRTSRARPNYRPWGYSDPRDGYRGRQNPYYRSWGGNQYQRDPYYQQGRRRRRPRRQQQQRPFGPNSVFGDLFN